MVFFSVPAFPQGIGTENILALNELTTEENGKIYTVTRDGFKIKCLKRPEKKKYVADQYNISDRFRKTNYQDNFPWTVFTPVS